MEADSSADLRHTGDLTSINHAIDGLAGDSEESADLLRTKEVG